MNKYERQPVIYDLLNLPPKLLTSMILVIVNEML